MSPIMGYGIAGVAAVGGVICFVAKQPSPKAGWTLLVVAAVVAIWNFLRTNPNPNSSARR